MEFADLIKTLGERIGIALTPNEDGACILSVDDMTVIIQNVPEVFSIAFWGEIGEPPPQGQLLLQTAMLEANHLFHGTGGATISRDPDGGQYSLCRFLDSRCTDADAFVEVLEKFVNTLEAWRKLLADYRPEESEQSRPEEPSEVDTFGVGFMQV